MPESLGPVETGTYTAQRSFLVQCERWHDKTNLRKRPHSTGAGESPLGFLWTCQQKAARKILRQFRWRRSVKVSSSRSTAGGTFTYHCAGRSSLSPHRDIWGPYNELHVDRDYTGNDPSPECFPCLRENSSATPLARMCDQEVFVHEVVLVRRCLWLCLQNQTSTGNRGPEQG